MVTQKDLNLIVHTPVATEPQISYLILDFWCSDHSTFLAICASELMIPVFVILLIFTKTCDDTDKGCNSSCMNYCNLILLSMILQSE